MFKLTLPEIAEAVERLHDHFSLFECYEPLDQFEAANCLLRAAALTAAALTTDQSLTLNLLPILKGRAIVLSADAPLDSPAALLNVLSPHAASYGLRTEIYDNKLVAYAAKTEFIATFSLGGESLFDLTDNGDQSSDSESFLSWAGRNIHSPIGNA